MLEFVVIFAVRFAAVVFAVEVVLIVVVVIVVVVVVVAVVNTLLQKGWTLSRLCMTLDLFEDQIAFRRLVLTAESV